MYAVAHARGHKLPRLTQSPMAGWWAGARVGAAKKEPEALLSVEVKGKSIPTGQHLPLPGIMSVQFVVVL